MRDGADGGALMPAVKPKLVAYEAHARVVAALAAAEERLAIQQAELDGARADLAAVVRIIRAVGGYLKPEDQQAIWTAQARLAGGGWR